MALSSQRPELALIAAGDFGQAMRQQYDRFSNERAADWRQYSKSIKLTKQKRRNYCAKTPDLSRSVIES